MAIKPPEIDREGLFIGDLVEDSFKAVVSDIIHEIRPDVVFAGEFPAIEESLKSMEPKKILRGIVMEMIG